MRTPALAEKAWRWQLEQFAAARPVQLLTLEETERRLDQLLVVRVPGPGNGKKCELEEFRQFIRDPASRTVLATTSQDLALLAIWGNPVWQSVVDGYAKIVFSLARGKTKGTLEHLMKIKACRKGITTELHKTNRYMNWFEVTKLRKPSGIFAEYLRLAEKESTQRLKRRDRISVYLDFLETQF